MAMPWAMGGRVGGTGGFGNWWKVDHGDCRGGFGGMDAGEMTKTKDVEIAEGGHVKCRIDVRRML
jgi:hypothetical protein